MVYTLHGLQREPGQDVPSGRENRSQLSTREDGKDDDFSFVLGGTLTLLGLLIGFAFSMAVGRYDLRKNLEEQEANAIGTEYVRADLLPDADAARVVSVWCARGAA